MPKANPFQTVNDKELKIAADFATVGLASVGAAVKFDESTNILTNDKGVTFAILPCPTKDGRVWFDLNPLSNNPCCFGKRPDWLGLMDIEKSELHLVKNDNFLKALAEAQQKVHPGMLVQPGGSETRVFMVVDWAKSVGLVSKTIPMKVDGDKFKLYRDQKMAVKEQFVHLHNHSSYSLLDGASTISGMVEKAVMNGQPGLALTDHGFMFGTWKFYKECKDWGIRSILGCEAYLVDDVNTRYKDRDGKDRRFEYHVTLLAMNQKGWENLCELMSLACKDHYYYVSRIDHRMLFKYSEGLIVLSGCFKGAPAWHLQKFEQPPQGEPPLPDWYCYSPDRSRKIIRKYKEVLGDRYFGEIHSNDFKRYMDCVPELVNMFHEEGVPMVVAGDCHYELFEDAAFQAMLSKINQGGKIDEIGDKLANGGPYYIKSVTEFDRLNGLLTEDMFTRTCEILERCKVDFPKGYVFPRFPIEEDADYPAYMAYKAGQQR